MLVFTKRGWRPLKRMTAADLLQASRALPGASREAVVALADETYAGAQAAEFERNRPRWDEEYHG